MGTLSKERLVWPTAFGGKSIGRKTGVAFSGIKSGLFGARFFGFRMGVFEVGWDRPWSFHDRLICRPNP
jgi:hypothetical protein